jgi:hypothetical protein
MSFERLAELIQPKQHSAARQLYEAMATAQQPVLYPYPELVADVRAGHFGYWEISRDG